MKRSVRPIQPVSLDDLAGVSGGNDGVPVHQVDPNASKPYDHQKFLECMKKHPRARSLSVTKGGHAERFCAVEASR